MTAEAKHYDFTTYDLEWWPGTYQLRLIGVYDPSGGYRSYRHIGAFLEAELTRARKGRRFYAHFGGSSDVIFIIQHILEHCPDVRISAIFAGSSAVVVRIQHGKDHWCLVDSGYLIRRPLRDIGKWIGLEKGDKDVIYSENESELIEYNERDCRILYEAIERLQSQVNKFGGELRTTLAASALDLFRRRYLKRYISTSRHVNDLARRAYIASRVEVFGKRCDQGEYYDINSSFPASMTRPQPADPMGLSRKIPRDPNACYLVDATVRVRDCYLPPLAYRDDKVGRIVFPTGQWRGIFDAADIQLLEESGHDLIKVHECTLFEPFSDLADYVHEIYKLKETATGYEREVWKLFLNALYGKFAERSEKRKILIRPESTRCTHDPKCPDDDSCIELIAPNIYAIREEREVKHAHVPISVHTTALSRAALFRFMRPCKRLYYCDTDSLTCSPEDLLATSTKLGDLKHEYSVREGTFLAPKLYTFVKPDGKRVIRAKGFTGLDYERFTALAEGKDVKVKRMQRMRESLNLDGTVTPRDVEFTKGIHLRNTKRRFIDGGADSVPWRVSDLQ